MKGQYIVKVPALDPDGNERGTLNLPAIDVPVATYTSWNLRGESIGAAGELLSLQGAYIPFPLTRAARKPRKIRAPHLPNATATTTITSAGTWKRPIASPLLGICSPTTCRDSRRCASDSSHYSRRRKTPTAARVNQNMDRLVTTTHLEMTSRAQLRPATALNTTFDLIRAQIPSPELNRFLYTAVGANWCWFGRRSWSKAQWLAYLDRADLETWVAYVSGTPAGYFELERQSDANVEIVYFGLLPAFIGKKLGGPLLTAAVCRAWDMGAKRVWVHTCDLDHPKALANYEARGFKVFHVESKLEQLPDQPLEVWPGADVR